MDNWEEEEPRVNSEGFVVNDWRNQNKMKNRVQQPGFLQTMVMKAWSTLWSPISKALGIGKHPPQNQLKSVVQQNNRIIEPQQKRAPVFRRLQYSRMVDAAVQSNYQKPSPKSTSAINQQRQPERAPTIQQRPISYQALQAIINNNNIAFKIKRISGIDIYQLEMNPQMTCIYDTDRKPIPLDMNQPFMVNDVVRLLKRKEHARKKRVQQSILVMRRQKKEMQQKQKEIDRDREIILQMERNRLNELSEKEQDSEKLLLAPHPSSASSSFARPEPKITKAAEKHINVPIHVSPFYQQNRENALNELPEIELSPIHPIPQNMVNVHTPSSSEQLTLRAENSFHVQSSPFFSSQPQGNPFLMDLIKMGDKRQPKPRNNSTGPKKKKVQRVDD